MLLIAHRGASGYAPENTLAAFRLALQMGAEAVELDIHQTFDRQIVVLHDPDLKRVAGARVQVRNATYPEILGRSVGAWFAPKFKGERVPRLGDVLDLVGLKAGIHIEIKEGSRRYPGIEAQTLQEVGRRQLSRRVVFSSFDHAALRSLRALDSDARLGYLVGRAAQGKALREAAQMQCESIHLSARQVSPEWVESAHRLGMRILVYTINKASEFKKLKSWGVDGVFSNYPDLV